MNRREGGGRGGGRGGGDWDGETGRGRMAGSGEG